jgi:hypothetical protein
MGTYISSTRDKNVRLAKQDSIFYLHAFMTHLHVLREEIYIYITEFLKYVNYCSTIFPIFLQKIYIKLTYRLQDNSKPDILLAEKYLK